MNYHAAFMCMTLLEEIYDYAKLHSSYEERLDNGTNVVIWQILFPIEEAELARVVGQAALIRRDFYTSNKHQITVKPGFFKRSRLGLSVDRCEKVILASYRKYFDSGNDEKCFQCRWYFRLLTLQLAGGFYGAIEERHPSWEERDHFSFLNKKYHGADVLFKERQDLSSKMQGWLGLFFEFRDEVNATDALSHEEKDHIKQEIKVLVRYWQDKTQRLVRALSD